MPDPPDLVRARIERGVGRLTLNRPDALNAVTLGMVERIAEVLDDWHNLALSAVLIESSSPKAFCAGGDIRAVRDNTLAGVPQASESFFRAEYQLNYTLATYSHPVVALIDGICMGGGLGLSVHGPFRVVTERAVLAMPETSIGFFPDVGASYFLPRLPGALGMYLGLTGTRLDVNDAMYCGLATHTCSSQDLGALTEALLLRGHASLDEVLRRYAVRHTRTSTSPLAQHRAEIDWCFNAPSLGAIGARLAELDSAWGRAQLTTLSRMSPQSLQVTFELLTRGHQRDLAACLRAELDATEHVTASHDFVEGIRAALVDRDHSPAWSAFGFNGMGALHDQTAGSPA